ncbi:RNA-directed DNA polymerase (reverse transcriptase)-related family protein, partial [Thalictrum thalictroides]
GINALFNSATVKHMAYAGTCPGPTHILFVDDIVIFINGHMRGLRRLKKLLLAYQQSSGQSSNPGKSKLFLGAMSIDKKRKIEDFFDIKEGALPERYLGVPLFKGSVKKSWIQILVDKIKKRASSWAGRMLSFQGRVVLIQSVLSSIPIHNMGIYKWPRRCLEEGEAAIRNFLWSGDPTQRRAITLKWESVCKPREEGGLGIRKLRELNLSLLMKLAWQLLEQKTNWSKFMTAKFKNKKGNWVNYHKSTLTWGGIKWALQEMKPYIGWIVGDGTSIDLWRDSWVGQAISDRVQFDWVGFRARLSDIITDGQWSIPAPLANIFSNLGIQLIDVPPPFDGQDTRIWKPSSDGSFSVKVAFDNIRKKAPKCRWHNWVWAKHIHPRVGGMSWKILQKAVTTDDK